MTPSTQHCSFSLHLHDLLNNFTQVTSFHFQLCFLGFYLRVLIWPRSFWSPFGPDYRGPIDFVTLTEVYRGGPIQSHSFPFYWLTGYISLYCPLYEVHHRRFCQLVLWSLVPADGQRKELGKCYIQIKSIIHTHAAFLHTQSAWNN